MSHADQRSDESGQPTDGIHVSPGAATAQSPETSEGLSRPVVLRSLASQYIESQHALYLDSLDQAIQDPRNHNIALSGPYGAGKSSVLDKFEEKHNASTLRLAIPTLAPDTEGMTLTNRIQKEVLKQVLYSARPRTLRHSQFSRRGPLPWWRALGESALFVGVLGALLALLGRLPSQVATGVDHSGFEQTIVWVAVAALLVGVFAVLRMVTYDRFVISDVSAAGATLSLSTSTNTYFDEYLDEIVYFFDQESKDFVIFEDLDRYNDPQIFQALRELNTLLNNTPKRRKKIEKHMRPLRFIYAMRDSLFEKIGEDTAAESGDAARAEMVRANRTKFFEIVIPMVPFISHRTAREHLHGTLREAGITSIERSLVELVAKHVTDMRLLQNISNEYLIFSKRLLESDKIAPELSASNLFALVAYKNFHPSDFERISRRSSDLDSLYDYHRALVATSITDREQAKRDLLAKNARPPAIGRVANRIGGRLVALGKAERDRSGRPDWHLFFIVGSERYASENATEPEFWDAIIQARTISLQAAQHPQGGGDIELIRLSEEHLEGLFPEALAGRWEERDAGAVEEEVQKLDSDIDRLRGADFKGLINAPIITLIAPAPGEDDTIDDEELTFAQFVNRTLKSDLARDLVKHGYIDRNFTLYAAQFYGDFVGADVATFIVQTVQTNSINVNYRFTSPGAIANLLSETDEAFTRTTSAYNLQVLDYLLVNHLERADEVVNHLAANFGADAQRFLAAFFTANGQRTRLAERLSSQSWQNVFHYLVTDEGVPSDARRTLVDAALAAADTNSTYDLGEEFTDFVVTHYKGMAGFTEHHPKHVLQKIVTILRRAEVLLPSIDGIHEDLRTLIVDNDLYELTAGNLRTALDITGEVTLDRIRNNDTVYQHCLTMLDGYMDAVEADEDTDYSVRKTETLIDALNTVSDADETVKRLTAAASLDSSLQHLVDAPESTWPALASAMLFRASLDNLAAYRSRIGEIDEDLGRLLINAGAIHLDDGTSEDTAPPSRQAEAIAILNASGHIPSVDDRVKLVDSLGLNKPIPAAHIKTEGNNLFARLIERGLVTDDATTFTHLRKAGWAAVEPAIVASNHVTEFLTPDMLDGMITNLCATSATSSKLGPIVLERLAEFLPVDELEALREAAKLAIRTETKMPVDQIRRVTLICKDSDLAVQLLHIANLSATEIVTVLHDLGGKYTNLTGWKQNSFEVPYDGPHRAVFGVLGNANICRSSKKPGKPLLIVKRP